MTTLVARLGSTLLWPLLLAIAAVSAFRIGIPTPVADGSANPAFSMQRALDDLAHVARQPHPIGSAANREVRDFLVGQLRALGFEVEVQRVAMASRLIDGTLLATVENIVARRRGSNPLGKALMLMTHYDAQGHSPGAADAGSGVVTILEAIRANTAPLANDLVVVFSDGEEPGLLGAQAFVDKHPLAKDIGLILNFEARGTAGPVMMFETSADNAALIAGLAQGAIAPVADSLFDAVYRLMPNATDMSVTKAAGIPGMNFAFIEGAQHYHNSGDSLEHLDSRSVAHAGSYALPLLAQFGNTALPLASAQDSGFFNLTATTLVRYPLWLAYALLAAAVLAFVVVLRGRERGGALWRELMQGAAYALLLLIATWLGTGLLNELVHTAAGEAALHGLADWLLLAYAVLAVGLFLLISAWVNGGVRFYGNIVGAVVALCFALLAGLSMPPALVLALIVGLLLFALRGRPRAAALRNGAFGLLLLIAAVAVVLRPAAMHVLLLPALAMLLIELAGRVAVRDAARREFGVGAVSLALGVVWIAYYARTLHMGLGAELPGLAFVPVMLLLATAAPLARSVPLLAAQLQPVVYAVAGALMAVAVCFDAADPQRREANEVAYIRDLDASKAWWATTDRRPDGWVRGILGAKPEQLAQTVLFPTGNGRFQVAPAPLSGTDGPQVALLADADDGQLRRVSLRVTPEVPGADVSLFVGDPKQIVEARIDGAPIELQNGRNGWWRWRYYAMPGEGVKVDIALKSKAQLHARVTETRLGWPDAARTTIAARPANTLPDSHSYSDMTLTTRSWPPPAAGGTAPAAASAR